MRAFFYGVAALVMLSAALAIALLPRITNDWLFFMIGGAILSWAISGSWVVLGATAGDWVRPRTGQVLIACGSVGALFNLFQAEWLALGWSALVILIGIGFAVRIFPVRQSEQSRSRTVRPPFGRS